VVSCMSARHVADTHADGQADRNQPPALTFKGDPSLLCGTRAGQDKEKEESEGGEGGANHSADKLGQEGRPPVLLTHGGQADRKPGLASRACAVMCLGGGMASIHPP